MMIINSGNSEFLFAAFYVFSFLIVLYSAIRLSHKEKLPTGSVLLVLAITTFSTVIGSRLFTIPVRDWTGVLISTSPEIEPGRSAIGGLLFGLTSFLISVKTLGLGDKSLAIYAWITPLALGLQKVGCFFNGCCFGVTTDSVFGVVYPRGTGAHFSHLMNGLIGAESQISGKVIPVQLIEMFIYVLIAWVVWLTRNRWRQKISIILFFFIMLFSARFLTEFLRDPLSSPFREIFSGIRVFQWFLLTSAIVLLSVLFIIEKTGFVIKKDFWLTKSLPLGKAIAYLTLVSAMIFSFRGLLVFYERVSLCIIFIPAILFIGYQFLVSAFQSVKVYLKVSLFAVPMLFMFPVMVQDTARLKKVRQPYYNHEVTGYRKVDVGTSWGKYYSTVYYDPHEGECGTSYTSEDYENVFAVGGAGYSIVSNRARSVVTKGINVFGGTIKEHNLTSGESATNFTGGLNPYIKIDGKWAGAGIGLYAGDLNWIIQRQLDKSFVDNSLRSSPVMPQVELRLGRKDILDVRYSYGMNSYASFPVLINEISIGSGFGNKTDLSLRIGIESSGINDNPFVSGEFLVNKAIGVNLKYHFGTKSYNYNSTNPSNLKSNGIFNIGASYRFGFEK